MKKMVVAIVWPKPFGVRAKIAAYKALKLVGLSQWRSRFVAEDAKTLNKVMYDTFKKVVNEDFTELFRAYDGQALLLWGREDTATPLKSAEKIATLIPRNRLAVFEGDHYFFLQHADAVAAEIGREISGGTS